MKRPARMVLALVPLLGLLASAPAAQSRQIVGGADATAPWPAMASVWTSAAKGRTLCGGTLIAPRWVLTAAHCFDSKAAGTIVRLGGQTLSDPAASTFVADEVIRHEGYDEDAFRDDLALLRLRRPADNPPQLIAAADDAGLSASPALATILGWGAVVEGGALSLTRAAAGAGAGPSRRGVRGHVPPAVRRGFHALRRLPGRWRGHVPRGLGWPADRGRAPRRRHVMGRRVRAALAAGGVRPLASSALPAVAARPGAARRVLRLSARTRLGRARALALHLLVAARVAGRLAPQLGPRR